MQEAIRVHNVTKNIILPGSYFWINFSNEIIKENDRYKLAHRLPYERFTNINL